MSILGTQAFHNVSYVLNIVTNSLETEDAQVCFYNLEICFGCGVFFLNLWKPRNYLKERLGDLCLLT